MEDFSRSLDAVLGRWSANQKAGDRKVQETSVFNTRPSYSGAVQWYRKKNGKEDAEQTLLVVTPDHPKTFALAVVVRRFNSFNNWEEIQTAILKLSSHEVIISHFSGNKGLIWCRDLEVKNAILKIGLVLINMKNVAILSEWKASEKWECNFLKVKNNWTGIEGIPLDLWNVHALKTIGGKMRKGDSNRQGDVGTLKYQI